jgi:hypothetical protein
VRVEFLIDRPSKFLHSVVCHMDYVPHEGDQITLVQNGVPGVESGHVYRIVTNLIQTSDHEAVERTPTVYVRIAEIGGKS